MSNFVAAFNNSFLFRDKENADLQLFDRFPINLTPGERCLITLNEFVEFEVEWLNNLFGFSEIVLLCIFINLIFN